MDIGISVVVTLVLVVAGGFFSLSGMALANARQVVLQKEADEGDRRAKRVLTLAEDPDRSFASIRAIVTLMGFAAAAIASMNLSAPLADWLSSFGVDWLTFAAPGLAPTLIVLAVSYLSVVVGTLVPKRIALSSAERASKVVAGPLSALRAIAKPLVWFTAVSANGLACLLRIKKSDDRQNVSEEEIKHIVKDNDELLDDEKRMIHDILDLGDMTVREVMQPRVDMMFVEDVETVRQAVDRMRGTGYSRLPVYHEDYDTIVGIVNYKDLVAPILDGKGDEPVGPYAYEALFVPETKDVYPLLSEMQTNRQQMAIVVDEYGGTDGLITVEDILEEIVGEIGDETDVDDGKFVSTVAEGEWVVDGRLPAEDAAELGWPVSESDDYETIAGWLMSTIDVVPSMGDEFEIEGYRFKIQAMRRRRISTIRVSRIGTSANGAEEPFGEGSTGGDPSGEDVE